MVNKNKILFCETCLVDTECKYEEGIRKEKIDDIKIEYLEKRYVCLRCHEKVYDSETYDWNVFEANKKLREKTGLITVDDINEISEKYNIGVKPLAVVLEVGEATMMRYLAGKNPTKEISDRLKMALRSPEFFEMALMKNKEKLTDIAFKKALGKVKQLELSSGNSKVYQVALYVISKYEDTTNMALQKILYFLNGFSSKFLDDYLFNDLAQAWIHGPVYKDVYDSLSYYKSDFIEAKDLLGDYKFDLTDLEKEYIDNVASLFACFSGSCLRNMSHLTNPWIIAREGLEEEEYSDRIIDQRDIKKYFEDIISKYDIKNYDDIKRYIEDLLLVVNDSKKKVNN